MLNDEMLDAREKMLEERKVRKRKIIHHSKFIIQN